MKFANTTLCLIALSLLAACGGSTGAVVPPPALDPDELPVFALATVVIGNPEWDGTAKDSGDPVMETTDSTIDAGDYFGGTRVQALFSFDLDQIPANATILSAKLSLYQYTGSGTPYANHGDAVLDHVEYVAPFVDLYGIPAKQEAFVVVANDMTEGMHTVDVAAQLQADVDAGKERFQVRLRHVIQLDDLNGQDDSTRWGSADSAFTDRHPRLVITLAN